MSYRNKFREFSQLYQLVHTNELNYWPPVYQAPSPTDSMSFQLEFWCLAQITTIIILCISIAYICTLDTFISENIGKIKCTWPDDNTTQLSGAYQTSYDAFCKDHEHLELS